jgi:hypothetical protein
MILFAPDDLADRSWARPSEKRLAEKEQTEWQTHTTTAEGMAINPQCLDSVAETSDLVFER